MLDEKQEEEPVTTTTIPTGTPTRAWGMLALGVLAQVAGTILVSTPAFLIPLLHVDQHVPLARAGLLASAPTFGMVLTLVAWGALADRFGERRVIALGLGLMTVVAAAAMATTSLGDARRALRPRRRVGGELQRRERTRRRRLVP